MGWWRAGRILRSHPSVAPSGAPGRDRVPFLPAHPATCWSAAIPAGQPGPTASRLLGPRRSLARTEPEGLRRAERAKPAATLSLAPAGTPRFCCHRPEGGLHGGPGGRRLSGAGAERPHVPGGLTFMAQCHPPRGSACFIITLGDGAAVDLALVEHWLPFSQA